MSPRFSSSPPISIPAFFLSHSANKAMAVRRMRLQSCCCWGSQEPTDYIHTSLPPRQARKSHRPFNSCINDQQEPAASKLQCTVYEPMRVHTDRGWGEKGKGQSAKTKRNEVWEAGSRKKTKQRKQKRADNNRMMWKRQVQRRECSIVSQPSKQMSEITFSGDEGCKSDEKQEEKGRWKMFCHCLRLAK